TIPAQAEAPSPPPAEPRPSGEPVAPAASAPGEPPPATTPEQPAAARPTPPPEPPKPVRPVLPQTGGRPVRDLSSGGCSPRPQPTGAPEQRKPPTGRQSSHRIAPPPPQKPRQAGTEEKKPAAQSTGPRKIADIPADLRDSNKPIRIEDLLRPINRAPSTGGVPGTTVDVDVGEDDEPGKGGPKKRGAGGVAGRDQRHKQRQARATDGLARGEGGKGLLLDDGDRPQVKQLIHKKRKLQQGTQPRKGKVPIELPITVRSLSEAMGLQKGKLLMQLMEHGAPATININSTL